MLIVAICTIFITIPTTAAPPKSAKAKAVVTATPAVYDATLLQIPPAPDVSQVQVMDNTSKQISYTKEDAVIAMKKSYAPDNNYAVYNPPGVKEKANIPDNYNGKEITGTDTSPGTNALVNVNTSCSNGSKDEVPEVVPLK